MNWIEILNKLIDTQKPFVMATIVEKKGSSPREPGTRCFVTQEGIIGTIGGGELEERVKHDAIKCLQQGRSHIKTYVLKQDCTGQVTVFLEYFPAQKQLVIFGGGNVGRCLTQVMADTSFNVTVVEQRQEFAKAEDFPRGISIVNKDYLEMANEIESDPEKTHFVITTYSHETDLAVLEILSKKPYRYLGVIGSKKKAAFLKKKLSELNLDQDLIDQIKCPIGDPRIKGRLPKEIAISIAAQILSSQ